MTAKSCFVIGPIGLAGSEVRTQADDLMKYIITPVTEQFGYKAVRGDQMPEPGRITTQIVRQLKEVDLVIADLTGDNPNVYYELSLRHALGLALIQMDPRVRHFLSTSATAAPSISLCTAGGPKQPEKS